MQVSERFLLSGLVALCFALAALVAGGLYVVAGLMLGAAGAYLLYQGVQAHDSEYSDRGRGHHA